MSLLGDIINELVDSNESLSSPLLKTKVLATRLKNEELLSWVNHEVMGYSDEVELPRYRKYTADIKGTYIIGNTQYNDQPLPLPGFSENIKEVIYNMDFRQSVATIESYVKDNKSGLLTFTFSAEATQQIAFNIRKYGNRYFQLVSANKSISANVATEILSVIRSKLLDFMLKLEEEFGTEIQITDLKSKNKEITKIMSQTIITGDGNILNQGDSSNITASINITKGDINGLREQLEKNKVEVQDIDELVSIIDSDEPDLQNKTFGKKVNAWMNKMFNKALEGTWQIGLDTGAILLAEVIKKYYGM